MASPSLSSPTSDKRFWSSLRGRVDSLLQERIAKSSNLDPSMSHQFAVSAFLFDLTSFTNSKLILMGLLYLLGQIGKGKEIEGRFIAFA